jgi:hypothetical protein
MQCRKVFQKKTKNFNVRFFSAMGVRKHHKKYQQINLTPVLVLPLTHPPTTGGTDFFSRSPGPWLHAALAAVIYHLLPYRYGICIFYIYTRATIYYL